MAGFDPELPWGYHLSVLPVPGRAPMYIDAADRKYRSVRDAFWGGRLRLPIPISRTAMATIETIHAFMASLARQPNDARSRLTDLFRGELGYERVMGIWLGKEGLLTFHADGYANGLTDEGWSVLHMLHATRPVEVRQERPSRATVEQLAELGLGPEDRAERLARVEHASENWDVAFRRIWIGSRPTITLHRRGNGPIPVKQTVWTMTLDSPVQRDAIYDWLVGRMDRWVDWADLAAEQGGKDLTHRLLVLMATSELPADVEPVGEKTTTAVTTVKP